MSDLSLTRNQILAVIKFCEFEDIDSEDTQFKSIEGLFSAAYTCLVDPQNTLADKEASFFQKLGIRVKAIQLFLPFLFLGLSFAALQKSINLKDTSPRSASFLWGAYKGLEILFFIARATVAPGQNFEEMRKKGKLWALLSLCTTLAVWTAIAGPLSLPVSLFAALPIMNVISAPIAVGLKSVGAFFAPLLPHILPQANPVNRLVCSIALGLMIGIKNVIQYGIQSFFPSKKSEKNGKEVFAQRVEDSEQDISNIYSEVPSVLNTPGDRRKKEKSPTQSGRNNTLLGGNLDLDISPIKRSSSNSSSFYASTVNDHEDDEEVLDLDSASLFRSLSSSSS